MKGDVMVRSFGICTQYKNIESLNYEKRTLVEEAKKFFDIVVLINTRRVTYQFIRGQPKPILFHDNQYISDLCSLHVRSTVHRETSTSLLVHALNLCGCDIFDPIDRFSVGYASKLLSTVERFQQGVGSNSFFAFECESSLYLLEEVHKKNLFPLIAKPIAGQQGKGLQVLPDLDLANSYACNFFRSRNNQDEPLFLQTYESFVEEYRVLIVDGEVLGMVRKIPKEGILAANAAQGAKFIKANNFDLINFLLPRIKTKGVLGIDVAVNLSGDFHILEMNWAPSWRVFEEVTDINVSQFIVQHSFERLNE
jgi:RimK-like ATP-grasp domain